MTRQVLDTILRKCFSYGDLLESNRDHIDTRLLDATALRAARCISDATPCLKRSQSAADVRINKEASHRRHSITVFIDEHQLESISSDDGLDMQVSPMSSTQQLVFPVKGLQPRPDSSLSLCSQDSSSATMVSQSSSIAAECGEHMCALQPIRSGGHGEGVYQLETSASAVSLTSCDVLGSRVPVPAMGASPQAAPHQLQGSWSDAPLLGATLPPAQAIAAAGSLGPAKIASFADLLQTPLQSVSQQEQQEQQEQHHHHHHHHYQHYQHHSKQQQADHAQQHRVLIARLPLQSHSTSASTASSGPSRPSTPPSSHHSPHGSPLGPSPLQLPLQARPYPALRLSTLNRTTSAISSHSISSCDDASDSDASHEEGYQHSFGQPPARHRTASTPTLLALKPHLNNTFLPSAPSCQQQQRSIFDDPSTPSDLTPLGPSRSNSLPSQLLGGLTPRGSCPASPRSHCSMSGCESEEQHNSEGCEPLKPAAIQRLHAPIPRRNSYHLTRGCAAVELFYRLNHARQTLDFAKRQAQLFAPLDHAEMGLWEALQQLGELREYEAALLADAGQAGQLDPDMPLLEHAFQTAEICRLAHPELDWLHLAGLIHGLGKLLAHQRFGCQPQWAVCGETFPVGCRFDDHIPFGQYFSVNPDRRRRIYNTQSGIYTPGCGLSSVYMRWSGCEYLHMVLVLNRQVVDLPDAALFMIRHHKFASLTRPGSPYASLLNEDEQELLPLLKEFQEATAYRRQELPEGALQGQALHDYYKDLIYKYTGNNNILW